MLFDPATRAALGQTRVTLFPTLLNVSANFNGVLPPHLQKRLHYNPAPSVRATWDKANTLKRFNTPGKPFVDFFDNEIFKYEEFSEFSEDFASKIILRKPSGESLLTDMEDLLRVLRDVKSRQELRHSYCIKRTSGESHIAVVTAITDAWHEKLRLPKSGQIINNGILEYFSNVKASEEEVYNIQQRSIEIMETLGLDIATVSLFKEGDWYVSNVDAVLRVGLSEPLRAFFTNAAARLDTYDRKK